MCLSLSECANANIPAHSLSHASVCSPSYLAEGGSYTGLGSMSGRDRAVADLLLAVQREGVPLDCALARVKRTDVDVKAMRCGT